MGTSITRSLVPLVARIEKLLVSHIPMPSRFGQMFIGHADLSFYHKQISSVTFLMHTIFDGSFRIEVSHREPGILFDGGRCLAVR